MRALLDGGGEESGGKEEHVPSAELQSPLQNPQPACGDGGRPEREMRRGMESSVGERSVRALGHLVTSGASGGMHGRETHGVACALRR